MKTATLLLFLTFMALPVPARAEPLEAGFRNPPAETKPWCYWYWISDNLSKDGITKDLEAMARVGIGEALIGNIFLDDVKPGTVKVFTPEWWGLVEHAIREGGRTGVNIGMFNCPGWSQSGGPWIKPEQAMRHLAASETRVTGPAKFAGRLAVPKEPFQDVAVLAFPAPAHDAETLASLKAQLTATPPAAGMAQLVDGDPATMVEFPGGAGRGGAPFTIELSMPAPLTARSLSLVPGTQAFAADVELQAAVADGTFQTVRRFRCDRSNMAPGVGFMPRGPVTVAFPATTAAKFRLVFTGGSGHPQLAEINLTGAARLEAFVEKQLGKMNPTPLPMWDTYLWPTQAEPESPQLAVPAAKVLDLTKQLAPDGTLAWEVPPGEWLIQRIGMTPTGMKNSPASPEGQGLEVDKMNRQLADYHFNAFIGEVLKRVPAADRKAFTRVIADSYEMGSQNWTDGLDAQFKQRYGYDPKPWLPVLSGRLVGSADLSERFLWDLRRLVADRVATDYVGGLRDACKPHGLGLWLENYGHWGFPGEFLQYGGASDRIGGEYWVTGDLGSIECRAASSCANTYGKRFVSAEAFTGGPAFQNAPRALKARGDWSFCEGVNHFVLHVYIHQPWADKVPGVNAWFGTEFNRHNTWFEQGKAWLDYLRRCCWLLQQGHRVADVAYFIGDDAPKMTGTRNPELPPGRDFDYINSEVIFNSLTVKDGLLTLPHGTTYQALVVPDLDTMRPAVLRKLRDLLQAGATVVGRPPSRSPSMENHPQCDAEVRQLAAEIWGQADTRQPGERAVGKGRVCWGKPLTAILTTAPDFVSTDPLRFTHRRDGATDIYFVANPNAEPLATTAAFRAAGKAPELWWPDSGRIERPAVYDTAAGVVRLPLSFGPQGSVFVVFREPAAPAAERIVSVKRNGSELLGTRVTPPAAGANAEQPNDFTFAAWVKPAATTELGVESNSGAAGLGLKRNDALTPPHGNQFGTGNHAGCGLAVGINGVAVLEHGANYFVPTLVHAVSLPDWTHVAVVYRNGQPHLYLNGKPAKTGLKSAYTVHSGATGGGSAQFRGQLGQFVRFGRPLAAAEVAALARNMPRPDATGAGPVLRLTNYDRQTTALAALPGTYELQTAAGKTRQLTIAAVPRPQVLAGTWEVRFAAGWGAPEQTTFATLTDWTTHSDPAIKHFSGVAIYRKVFVVGPTQPPDLKLRTLLDLGEVRDLATVRVNGQPLGTLWLPPYQVDITSALKPGENQLEVEVVNPWNNRLLGDAALPPGQRRTYLQAPGAFKKNAPLLPAGWLGPAVLRHAVEIDTIKATP
jgi:hypothetical protein